MKTHILTVAMLAAFSLPVLAEDAAPAAPAGHQGGEMRGQMQQMREGFKADREKMRNENKAAFEAKHQACMEKMKAAKPEERDGIMAGCRAEGAAMRKADFDKREQMIGEHQAEADKMRGEFKARHEEMKAKREEMRGKRDEMMKNRPAPAAQ